MPLGLFRGAHQSSKQQQPQPHQQQMSASSSSSTAVHEKDIRGSVIKLQRTTVTLERKLAEGRLFVNLLYNISDQQYYRQIDERESLSSDTRIYRLGN